MIQHLILFNYFYVTTGFLALQNIHIYNFRSIPPFPKVLYQSVTILGQFRGHFGRQLQHKMIQHLGFFIFLRHYRFSRPKKQTHIRFQVNTVIS